MQSLKSGKEIFGVRKPSKLNVPGLNERAKELNVGKGPLEYCWTPRSGPLAELKCRTRAAFWHEMKFLRENEDQLRSQSMLSNTWIIGYLERFRSS